jgi:hypothetical protein
MLNNVNVFSFFFFLNFFFFKFCFSSHACMRRREARLFSV